jgi:hypothetical protein
VTETAARRSHRKSSPVALRTGETSRGQLVAAADAPEARSRQFLAAMMAFRDGDFSARLPTDWEGTDGRIAEAFNQALAHEDRISLDIFDAVELGGELFSIHDQPNPRCAVGANIQATLERFFDSAETALKRSLSKVTVADVAQDLARQAKAGKANAD